MSSLLKKKHGRHYLGTIQNKPENDDGLLDDGDDFPDSSLSLQIGSPHEDIFGRPFGITSDLIKSRHFREKSSFFGAFREN